MSAARKSTWIREAGLALAVLSLWMLSLLSPLHQTAGLVRELAERGYDTSGGWTFCLTADSAGTDDTAPVLCPAQGFGKSQILLPGPVILIGLLPLVRDRVASPEVVQNTAHSTPRGSIQPRAPPETV